MCIERKESKNEPRPPRKMNVFFFFSRQKENRDGRALEI